MQATISTEPQDITVEKPLEGYFLSKGDLQSFGTERSRRYCIGIDEKELI